MKKEKKIYDEKKKKEKKRLTQDFNKNDERSTQFVSPKFTSFINEMWQRFDERLVREMEKRYQ